MPAAYAPAGTERLNAILGLRTPHKLILIDNERVASLSRIEHGHRPRQTCEKERYADF